MAFADILLTETDAQLVIVDRFPKPGGHWNVAYPFVMLHQPSAFYGVSSRELSKGVKDQIGLNKGLGDLASGAEVSAYFDEVMRHQFLPTGRVQYFPMCDYQGNGQFASRLSGKKYTVTAGKTVDATYLKTSVPATHTPNFDIDSGVQFMPLNDLVNVTRPPAGFVVIGGGKTGIDACLWLLEQGVEPDNIRWIVPRDAWLLDRRNTQPAEEFFNDTMGAQAAQMESIANAESIEDMFDRLEASGYFLRIDKNVRPKMFHGATISKAEVEQLRRIKNVIRMGHVKKLATDEIVLDAGTVSTSPKHLHVDCSARAISNVETKPIFAGNLITPQMVRSYQPVFSAAFIAHVETNYETEAQKNQLCGVVPLPNDDTDYIKFTAAFMMNQYTWGQDKVLSAWLLNNRLDGFSKLARNINDSDTEKLQIMQRLRSNAMPAMAKLQQFLAELN
ncbi:MAG: NAD(P)/FAD-dependent oxidoreductase [Gammaproteobacteria bacterium]|nr:NAD(P)/FAD-dependent oxidoreductase [Gammaproteobacteria bacterium]